MSGTAPAPAPISRSIFSKPLKMLVFIFVLSSAGMGIYHAWRTSTTSVTPAVAPATTPPAPAPTPPTAPNASGSDTFLSEWLTWGGNILGAHWLAALAVLFLVGLFGTILWCGLKKLYASGGSWFTTWFTIAALVVGSLVATDLFLSGGRHTATFWQSIVAGWNNTTLLGGTSAPARQTAPALNANAVTMTWTRATTLAFHALPRDQGCIRWSIDASSFEAFQAYLRASNRTNAERQFLWEARGGGVGPKPGEQLQEWARSTSPTVFIWTLPC